MSDLGGVRILGALLLATLALAYASWTAGDPGGDEGGAVVLLPGEPAEIEQVVFFGEEVDLTLTTKRDDGGGYAWVEDSRRPKARPAPHAAGETEGAEPEGPVAVPEAVLSAYKSGKASEDLLAKLAPFEARRELGEVDAGKLAEFGLAEPRGRLTIRRTGKPDRSFDVGAPVFGGASTYVRDADSGRVYVIDAAVLRPIEQGATALMDRTLIDGTEKDIETVRIAAADGRSLDLRQHHRDDRRAAFWSRLDSEDRVDAAATWLDKILRLRALSYVIEAPSDLEPLFVVEFARAGGGATKLEVLRAPAADGQARHFARSQHTRGLAELSTTLAAEAAADLGTVLAGNEPPSPG